MKKFLIAASIISGNFACLGEEINKVLLAGADIIHFDVMDNNYVKNLTFGPMVLKSIRKYGIEVPISVHLMTSYVDNLIIDFVKSGADYISFHPESSSYIDDSLNLIKKNGCKAGLAFNPTTSIDCVKYLISKIDVILLMGVNPGFSGQSFLPRILNKIKKTKKMILNSGSNIKLEIDGGIKMNNIGTIASAGADILVSGSEIFNSDNYNQVINNMRFQLHNICTKKMGN